jgi:hypothetical protein
MRRLCASFLLLGPALTGAAQGVAIEHAGVACVVRNKYPRLEARLAPAGDVARARVFFHGDAGAVWYSVDMTSSAAAFQGVLPRPLKETRRVHYYIEALDKRATTSRTEEHAADVVDDAGACSRKGGAAAALSAAKVAIHGPTGAPAAPAGFAAAAAGGIGATALVIGGVAVAGGATAAVAVSKGSGGQEGSNGSDGSGGSVPPATTTPALPNMSLSGTVCNDRCCGTGTISPGPHGQTVAGATITTSVDGSAATTDGQGRFSLVTQTRCPA